MSPGRGPDIRRNAKPNTGLLVKRIQTLGGLAAFDGPRPLGGNAQQPRRLAILAILARAGDRGVSRDRLAGLLWGDVDEERARRSLNQALYALRQELGAEDAILGTRDLRFNPELIEVDLAAFETARASGAFEEAARLYAGPFLGDFHLPGVPDFARWADEAREGIAADYRALVEAAAAGATAREDRGGAVLWWRRLAALDPADTRAAQGLVESARGRGRRAGRAPPCRRRAPDPAAGARAAAGSRGRGAGGADPERRAGAAGRDTRAAGASAGTAPAGARRPAASGTGGHAGSDLIEPSRVGVGLRRAGAGRRAPRLAPAAVAGRSGGTAAARGASLREPGRFRRQLLRRRSDRRTGGRLAAFPGLEVVASLSSNDYRGHTRRHADIARELGVDYLLIGKIRWQKGAAGSSRVRVSPELIRLAPGAAPTTRWQQPFDAALTDVFAVQADIATKVADALGVVLGDSARRRLAQKPTESLAAYDEFLGARRPHRG